MDGYLDYRIMYDVIEFLFQVEGYSYTLQNIKEMNINDRAVGGLGLKLKVYRNGDYGAPAVVHFNTRQAGRGLRDKEKGPIFERVCDFVYLCIYIDK